MNLFSVQADMAIQTTRLEQDIEELQIRLQNIKMKLTAETKVCSSERGGSIVGQRWGVGG